MDAITAIGLVASLQQLADKTGRVCIQLCNYFDGVKEAPSRSKELRDELQTISKTLHSLATCLSNSSMPDLPPHILKAVKEFGEIIHNLEKQSSHKCTQGFRRFLWPFNEAKIQRTLLRIERTKATLTMALNIQQTYGLDSD